jgi:hypothetical protein
VADYFYYGRIELMPTKNLEKQRLWSRAHYQKNKDKYRARNKSYKWALRELVNALKAKPCQDCKKSYPTFVMDFHHRDPKTKLGNVGQLTYRGSVKRTLDEIAKCDLLCANCHRIREYCDPGVTRNPKV